MNKKEMVKKFAIGKVLNWCNCNNEDFNFETEKQGWRIIRNEKSIIEPWQKGKVLNCHGYGEIFKFETKEQGLVFIIDGKNVLEAFTKGKILDCCTCFNNDEVDLKTKEQGWVSFTKKELEKGVIK